MIKDDDTLDPDSPEIKNRYQKTMSAIEANESVIDMLYPHYQDAFYVAGHVVGSTLFKFIEREELDDMLARIFAHAKTVYNELEKAHKEEEKFAKEYLKH